MKDLTAFIELGWFTVPLGDGTIERLPGNKKTTPVFPSDYYSKYSTKKNENATALGAVLTGVASNILAIDCDNTNTANIFKSLDPDYEFVFVGTGKKDKEGKPIKSIAMIYKYEEAFFKSLSIHNKLFSFDLLSNNKILYLPTDNNKTKKPFTIPHEVKVMPESTRALITTLVEAKASRTASPTISSATKMPLFFLCEDALKGKQAALTTLLKIVTPKEYRVNNKVPLPKEIQGGRSIYLSRISAVFGADQSIDTYTYASMMNLLNNMLDPPLEKERFCQTILDPMILGKAMSPSTGKPIWQHNEEWQNNVSTLQDKDEKIIHLFYDKERQNYYVIDLEGQNNKEFLSDMDFYNYLSAVVSYPPSKIEIKRIIPLKQVTADPTEDYGYFSEEKPYDRFNLFKASVYLQIFNDSLEHEYSPPTTTLRFLHHLIEDPEMETYLLKFLKRKFKTFDYSPTVLYFLGASGAGKDVFVNLLEQIMGEEFIAKPSANQFIELFNGWMQDKYFMQLDEFGNQLPSAQKKDMALGIIKTITGSRRIQIRKMRTNSFMYSHNMTIILTSNTIPFALDPDDRRIALFNCKKPLNNQDWVIELGGTSKVIELLKQELPDFMYYLANKVEDMSSDEYTTPPSTKSKLGLIFKSMPMAQKIAFALQYKMWKEFHRLAMDFNCVDVFRYAGEGIIKERDIVALFSAATESRGHKKTIIEAMKVFNKSLSTTTDKSAPFGSPVSNNKYHIPGYSEIAKYTETKEDFSPNVKASTEIL